jgi:hypothetical protein
MLMNFLRIFVIAGLLASLLAGCSKEGRSAKAKAVPGGRTHIQRHSGSIAVSIIPESPTSGDDLRAVLSEGGNNLIYRWEKNGQILEGENSPRLTKNNFASGDTISVTVKAGNREGNASVTIANSPPEIRSVRFTPDLICKGVDITAVPDGFDADGDEIRYECKWIINGEETTEDSLVLKGNRIKTGDTVSAAITPYDTYDSGKTYRTQTITVPKAAPFFTSVPPSTFRGKIYTYNAVAKEPDGGSISYSLASAPDGMTIDEKTGRVSWPIKEGSAGLNNIEIVAQSSEGGKAVQRYSLNITLQPGASE